VNLKIETPQPGLIFLFFFISCFFRTFPVSTSSNFFSINSTIKLDERVG